MNGQRYGQFQSDSTDTSAEVSPYGTKFRFNPAEEFWAEVQQWGVYGNLNMMAYDWYEVRPIEGGGWERYPEDEGGRVGGVSSGTPAYEAGDMETPDGAVVWIRAGNWTASDDAYSSGASGSGGAYEETKDYRFAYESDVLAYGASGGGSGGGGATPTGATVECTGDGTLALTFTYA